VIEAVDGMPMRDGFGQLGRAAFLHACTEHTRRILSSLRTPSPTDYDAGSFALPPKSSRDGPRKRI
jgi:hypothetical protein